MSAAICPSGIEAVLRAGAHSGWVTRTVLGAVAHLTSFAECSAKHCFLFLNLPMNECTSSDLKLQLCSHQICHQKCCSISVCGILGYFQGCRCLPGPDTDGSCLFAGCCSTRAGPRSAELKGSFASKIISCDRKQPK